MSEKEEVVQEKLKLIAERDGFRDDLFNLNRAKKAIET